MIVTIEFYGRLKAEFSQEPIEWQSSSSTVEDIYQELCTDRQQPANIQVIKPILNDTFCEWSQIAKNGDVIGFFPPASGG